MAAQKKQKQPLDREYIVDTAYRMIDEQGYRSFTMRALGAELGVSAMAFYAHFSSREEMLAAVGERFMDTLDTDPVPGEYWEETLYRTMNSIRAEGLKHPHLNEVLYDENVAMMGLAKHTEKIVTMHLNQGIPREVLSKAWAMVDAFLTGFSVNETAIVQHKEEALAAAGAAEPDASQPGAVADDLPEWQSILFSAYTDESFNNGIKLIIEGIKSITAPDPTDWRTPE